MSSNTSPISRREARARGALVGVLAALSLGLAEALLRYRPRLQGTDLMPQAVLGVVATVGYLLLAPAAGLLHPLLPTGALVLVALLGSPGDPGAVLLAAAAGLLAIPAARHPRWSLPPLLLLSTGLLLRARPADTALPAPPHAAREVPDIVLVVLDTVAAHATSLHGAPLPTTPTLERLAREGTWFSEAVSPAPWTVPAHASMFTGELPSTLGCHHEQPRLPAGPPTIAEGLAARGYRTGAFVANPWVGSFNGLTRGFQHQENHWERVRAARAFSLSGLLPATPSKGGRATVQGALRWLLQPDRPPAFVFVNLLEAHSPFHQTPTPARFGAADPVETGERMHRAQQEGPQAVEDFPRPGEVEAARQLYAAAVHAADALLGELVAGLPPETLLVVTSDHGEALGEHGFYGHMVGLHQETLHVPLVLRGPGVPVGQRIDTPVSTRSLYHVLLDGPAHLLKANADAVLIAEQHRPLQVIADFQRGPVPASAELLARLDRRASRARQGAAVVLQHEGEPAVRYDLHTDPHEQNPLPVTAEHAHLLEALQAARPIVPITTEQAELPVDLRDQLRALGYLGDE